MNFRKQVIAISVLASIGSVAFAQKKVTPQKTMAPASSGFYIGVSGGQSKSAKVQDVDTNFEIPEIVEDYYDSFATTYDLDLLDNGSGSLSKNRTDSAYKFYVGYKINPTFSVEGGYAALGKTTLKGSFSGEYDSDFTVDDSGPLDSGGEFESSGKLTSKNTALFFDVVGALPINNSISLLGRVGAAYVTTKTSISGADSFLDYDNEDTDSESYKRTNERSKWVPKLGVGAEYRISPTVSVRAEYERYFNVGGSSVRYESNVDMMSVGLKLDF